MSFNRDSFSVQHKGRTLSLRINLVLTHKEETLILLLAAWYICDYQSSFPWECPKNAWLRIRSNVTFCLIASFSLVWQMGTAWPSSKCAGMLGGTWIAVNAVMYFLACCHRETGLLRLLPIVWVCVSKGSVFSSEWQLQFENCSTILHSIPLAVFLSYILTFM